MLSALRIIIISFLAIETMKINFYVLQIVLRIYIFKKVSMILSFSPLVGACSEVRNRTKN